MVAVSATMVLVNVIDKKIYLLASCGVDSHKTNNSDDVDKGGSQKKYYRPS